MKDGMNLMTVSSKLSIQELKSGLAPPDLSRLHESDSGSTPIRS